MPQWPTLFPEWKQRSKGRNGKNKNKKMKVACLQTSTKLPLFQEGKQRTGKSVNSATATKYWWLGPGPGHHWPCRRYIFIGQAKRVPHERGWQAWWVGWWMPAVASKLCKALGRFGRSSPSLAPEKWVLWISCFTLPAEQSAGVPRALRDPVLCWSTSVL